jgi:hypothetical protein
MKRVVSVSLGSNRRDHVVESEILGTRFRIERIGTNGDLDKAIEIVRSLDGKVDAFGMGGIDLYIVAGKRRYILNDARRIAEAARVTPIVDGSGLKNTLERRSIKYLQEKGIIDFQNKNTLLVCGVDRFGMAEALVESGASVTFGDLIFGLNVPVPIRSLRTLSGVARVLGPLVSRLPFKYLYPTGDKQEVITARFCKYYEENEIIAGDFHYIKRYMPEDLRNKIIITNTVIKEDVEILGKRGARTLITTTPEFQGRSFGTNVMEAVLVTLLDKPVQEITEEDYQTILDQVGFLPRIVNFAKAMTA